jgi:hypothetical protein
VRDAFETSVAWTAPPVSRQRSHVSTVPKASPSCDPASPRIHSSFVAEKYGSGVSPVRSRICSARSSRQRAAVRRSCQTIAGPTGRPESRRQTSVVSRWLAIPIASISRAAIPASASAAAAARSTLSQSVSGSCSTQPGRGAAAEHLEPVADDEAGRSGRALVDREDHAQIFAPGADHSGSRRALCADCAPTP